MYEYCGYHLDVVLCIDATNGMLPFIKMLQENVHKFYEQVMETIDMESMSCDTLRVKVITFRDFIACEAEPIKESKFFTLPQENDAFVDFVKGIEARGCGDEATCALEAMAQALKSDWTKVPGKKRYITLMFTDSPAHPLQHRVGCEGYPEGMPKDLEELHAWWEGTTQILDSTFDARWGRLVVFAPVSKPWTDMETWYKYWYCRIEDAELNRLNLQEIATILVGTT